MRIDNSCTVLVVGASRGLGLEFARQCLSRGARVLATARSAQGVEALSALGDESASVRVLMCDVGESTSVQALGAAIKGTTLTHVVHNAGIFGPRVPLAQVKPADMADVYRVNTIGALMVLQCVLPHMGKGAVWAVVGSSLGCVSLNDTSGGYAYRASKAALHMVAKSVSVDLKEELAVIALQPGWVDTEMNGGKGMIGVEESVSGMLAAVDRLQPDDELQLVSWDGEVLPW